MYYITRSTNGPQGWAQSKMAPSTSKAWDAFDRQWIDWLIDNGQEYVKVGDTMYNLFPLTSEV